MLAEEGVTASMVTLTRTSNTPYAVAYDHAPIRGIADEAKSIPREWINACVLYTSIMPQADQKFNEVSWFPGGVPALHEP